MALPTPSQLEDEIEEIRDGLSRLLDGYRWAYPMLYGLKGSQPVSGETELGKKTATPARGDVAWSDPTGNAAADRERTRENMKKATDALIRMRKQLESGIEALGRVFTDRGTHYDRPQEQIPAGRILTRQQLTDSREAKRRREAQGAGWGEG